MTDLRFGELLSRHRLAAGLTQEQLACKAGLTAQAISTLERGSRQSPRRRTVHALAEALELADSDRDEFTASIAPRAPRLHRAERAASPVRCLPPAVGDFTGRADHVERLRALLSPTASSTTVVVSAIGGMGGVGKTALAVEVGHQLADAFPDGQLYVNLRGFGPGEPMQVSDALTVLLSSIGMASADLPQDVDLAVARYRALLADKAVLVVLDNAADERQVECLLPTAARSAAIVTSRRTLAALPGAHHIQLDVLTEAESTELLTSIMGTGRTASEPDAVNRIADLCGRLPLAIRIAGARLAARPTWPLSAFADQLADERRRLDMLEQHDIGVRATLGVSHEQLARSSDPLEQAAATALPLLGLLEFEDFSVPTVARLIDHPRADASKVLDRLVDLHLVSEYKPERYRLHDLVRAFAAERASVDLSESDCYTAFVRVLRMYNTAAWRSFERANPNHARLAFADPALLDDEPEVVPVEDAEAWLADESQNLVAFADQLSRSSNRPVDLLLQLEMGTLNVFLSRGMWTRWMRFLEPVRQVAEQAEHLVGQAFVVYDLAGAFSQLGYHPEAESGMQASLELFRRTGSRAGEAMALCHLAHVLEMRGAYEQGIRHAHRALELATQGDHRHLAATTCLALSMLYGGLNDREPERRYAQRSIEMFTSIGYKPGRARALYNLGLTHSKTGREDEALRLLLNAADSCEDVGLVETKVAALTEAAAIRVRQGSPALAIEHCNRGLEAAQRFGCEISEARSRRTLGDALVAGGMVDDGHLEWSAALSIYERLGAAVAADVRMLLAEGDRGSAQSGARAG